MKPNEYGIAVTAMKDEEIIDALIKAEFSKQDIDKGVNLLIGRNKNKFLPILVSIIENTEYDKTMRSQVHYLLVKGKHIEAS